MTREIKKYLFDIHSSIESINSFIGVKKDFFEFQNNTLVNRAVERELQIIGEAINKIIKIDQSISITNARKIVDLRNFIIHSYDKVSEEIIWSIIIKDIPILEKEINAVLQDDLP